MRWIRPNPPSCLNSRGGSSLHWSLFSSPSLLLPLGAALGGWTPAGADPATLGPSWMGSSSGSSSADFFPDSESLGVSGRAASASLFRLPGATCSPVPTGAAGDWLIPSLTAAPEPSEGGVGFSATWSEERHGDS